MSMRVLFLLAVAIMMQYCTPKKSVTSSQKVDGQEKNKTPDQEAERIARCPQFGDNKYSEDSQDAYVIYNNFINVNNFQDALSYWERIYKHNPAAFGNTYEVYSDGILIYEYFYNNAKSDIDKEKYKKKILSLYDEAMKCFPTMKAKILGDKAYDLLYKFSGFSTEKEIYHIFKNAIKDSGNNSRSYIVSASSVVIHNLAVLEEVDLDSASQFANTLVEIIQYNREKKPNDKYWKSTEEYTDELFANLEGFKGFYNCAYYQDKYLKWYTSDMTNCDTLRLIYSKLISGQCSAESPQVLEIKKRLDAECESFTESEDNSSRSNGYLALQNGNYSKAISFFEDAIDETSEKKQKAAYYHVIAQIYYVHLRKYADARKYALKAAAQNPEWGAPYIMIGKLYASSGPLCGTGTGWNSQVVTWVAIDMWEKAKNVDPGVAGEANKLINRYTQYMPSKGDIFQRNLNIGDSYKVSCWIQQTTRIRAAN